LTASSTSFYSILHYIIPVNASILVSSNAAAS